MRELLLSARKAAADSRALDRPPPASLQQEISNDWDKIVNEGLAFHNDLPPLPTSKPGRTKRRPGHNCALRLQNRKEDCLRFLYDPRVPFSNNEGERQFRMSKLRQKISGGFRTLEGAIHFADLRTVTQTARKQGWNVLDILAHPDPGQLIPLLCHHPPPPPLTPAPTTEPIAPG